jgi:hypothetical protein
MEAEKLKTEKWDREVNRSQRLNELNGLNGLNEENGIGDFAAGCEQLRLFQCGEVASFVKPRIPGKKGAADARRSSGRDKSAEFC